MYYLQRTQKNYFIYLLLFMYFTNFGSINNCFAQIKHTVSFSKSDLEIITEVERDGNTYAKVAFSSLQSTKDTGKPCLPVKYIKLIIPADQDVKNIIIDKAGTSDIQLSYPIAPAQSPVPLSAEDVVPEFIPPDTKIYRSDEYYPSESVKLVHSGYFDGNNHIVTLAIYPVQYNPQSSEILFNDAIDFTLNLTDSESPKIKVQSRNAKNQKIYDTILKRLVDNPADIALYQNKPTLNKINTLQKTTSVPTYEYVIITSNSFASSFEDFITWKIRKGIDIGIVTIENILANYSGDYISGIYDGAGSIRQYLSDAYQSGTVWALIAGDHITSPIRYGAGQDNALWTDPCDQAYKIPADLYFADFTGDWNVDTETPTRYGEPYDDDPDYEPEIFVGRLRRYRIHKKLPTGLRRYCFTNRIPEMAITAILRMHFG
ncbi:MAG TPA: C25 family cysteine peptidase, partial [Candidatus Marinimicrobia bacterium]|nr:C25 family cysteine peptidase [Candidatus Neomarinimicrobiota bacterium]